jgi:hypothetical protein
MSRLEIENRANIMNPTEERLERLRKRVKEIRTAKQWLESYQIVAPPEVSTALGRYYAWLTEHEQKTIQLGKRIKAQSQQQ